MNSSLGSEIQQSLVWRAINLFCITLASTIFLNISDVYAANGELDYIAPETDDLGFAPDSLEFIGGLWAIIEPSDKEVHFFDRALNKTLSVPEERLQNFAEVVGVEGSLLTFADLNGEKYVIDFAPVLAKSNDTKFLVSLPKIELNGRAVVQRENGGISFVLPDRSNKHGAKFLDFGAIKFVLNPVSIAKEDITVGEVLSYLDDGGAIVKWTESSNYSDLPGRTFVARYSAKGILLQANEVPLWESDVPSNRPVAASPSGQVMFMRSRGGVKLVPLKLLPVDTFRNQIKSDDRLHTLKSFLKGDFFLPKFDKKNVRKSGKLNTVTRASCRKMLNAYLNVEITLNAKNLARSGIKNNCTAGMWKPSKTITGTRTGDRVRRMVYGWGKWDTPVSYMKKIKKGWLASDVCARNTYKKKNGHKCPKSDCVIWGVTAGVDCSGLVSAVWKLKNKHGTSNLSQVSTKINNKSDLKYCDILLKKGHVFIVEKIIEDPSSRKLSRKFRIVDSSVGYGGVSQRLLTDDYVNAYKGYRFNNIAD